MAAGDTLVGFTPLHLQPTTSTNAARPDVRNGHPILRFDPSTQERAYFAGIMPRHLSSTGGITAVVGFTSTTTSTSSIKFNGQLERKAVGTSVDSDSFSAVQTVTSVGPGATEPAFASILFGSTQIDSIVGGDPFRLLLVRDATSTGDDFAVDVQVHSVHMYEST